MNSIEGQFGKQVGLRKAPVFLRQAVNQGPTHRALCRRLGEASRGRSIILHGPAGIGKRTLARLYARAAFCEAPLEDGTTCGTCEYCHQFKSSHPFGYVDIDASKLLPGKLAGRLRDYATFANFDSKRVVLIANAQAFKAVDYDQLLKVVEDAGTTFILTVEKLSQVRRAIQSRCEVLQLRPIPAAEAKGLLVGDVSYDPTSDAELLDLLVAYTEGFPGKMKAFIEMHYASPMLSITAVRRTLGLNWPRELLPHWGAILRRGPRAFYDLSLWPKLEALERTRRVRAAVAYTIGQVERNVDYPQQYNDPAFIGLDAAIGAQFIRTLEKVADERALTPLAFAKGMAATWARYVVPALSD